MKRMQLFSSASIVLIAAVLLTGCKPSRVWATKDRDKHKDRDEDSRYEERHTPPPPPPARAYASPLIITPSPGFVMNRSANGRYYHRTNAGLLYWKAYDNRFFLDRSYFRPSQYSSWEYQQWAKLSGAR